MNSACFLSSQVGASVAVELELTPCCLMDLLRGFESVCFCGGFFLFFFFFFFFFGGGGVLFCFVWLFFFCVFFLICFCFSLFCWGFFFFVCFIFLFFLIVNLSSALWLPHKYFFIRIEFAITAYLSTALPQIVYLSLSRGTLMFLSH